MEEMQRYCESLDSIPTTTKNDSRELADNHMLLPLPLQIESFAQTSKLPAFPSESKPAPRRFTPQSDVEHLQGLCGRLGR